MFDNRTIKMLFVHVTLFLDGLGNKEEEHPNAMVKNYRCVKKGQLACTTGTNRAGQRLRGNTN